LEEQALAWSEAEWLQRSGSGFQHRELATEVFKLSHPPTDGKAVYKGMALNNGDYALVALLTVKTEAAPDSDTDTPAQPETTTLQAALGETEYQEFIASLKANADIKRLLDDSATP